MVCPRTVRYRMRTPPISHSSSDLRSALFRDGSMPAHESAGRKLLIRGTAVLAIAVTLGYLTWRVAAGTVNLGWWWVAIPLLVVEIHNAFGLILYTFALWSLDRRPAAGRRDPEAPDRDPHPDLQRADRGPPPDDRGLGLRSSRPTRHGFSTTAAAMRSASSPSGSGRTT